MKMDIFYRFDTFSYFKYNSLVRASIEVIQDDMERQEKDLQLSCFEIFDIRGESQSNSSCNVKVTFWNVGHLNAIGSHSNETLKINVIRMLQRTSFEWRTNNTPECFICHPNKTQNTHIHIRISPITFRCHMPHPNTPQPYSNI